MYITSHMLYGYLQIFEIVGSVYQYIKLLRQVSPQEWIFRELQDIGNMSFRFMQDQPQDDYAVKLGGFFFVIESPCLSYLSASITDHKMYQVMYIYFILNLIISVLQEIYYAIQQNMLFMGTMCTRLGIRN